MFKLNKQRHRYQNRQSKQSGPRGYTSKQFSCSAQLCMKVKLFIKGQMLNFFLALDNSDAVFILLINVKMPTIVGVKTFMSRINLLHS